MIDKKICNQGSLTFTAATLLCFQCKTIKNEEVFPKSKVELVHGLCFASRTRRKQSESNSGGETMFLFTTHVLYDTDRNIYATTLQPFFNSREAI